MTLGRTGRCSRLLLLAVAFAALSAGHSVAQDDPAEEPSAFEDEVETVAPIRLRSGEGKQLVEIIVHLWGGVDGGPVDSDAVADAQPRTLEVVAQSPPPFVQGLRILQAQPQAAGASEDTPLRFVQGSTLTFPPGETARPIRLEFDLVKEGAASVDPNGLASGELVVMITSGDAAVVPAKRKIVLPFEFRTGEEPPQTSGAKVQMLIRTREKIEGGTGILSGASTVSFSWEDVTEKNAHPYRGFDPYVRLTWAEATPDRFVIARGRVTGGIPAVDHEIKLSDRGGMNPFHARFRHKHEFNILVDVGRKSAGTFQVSGKLLAFPHDTDGKDESRAAAVLPFSASFTFAAAPITGKGKVSLSRSTGFLSASATLEGIQRGKRSVKFQVGGRTRFAMLSGSGSSSHARVSACGVESLPANATLTFANFGGLSTVTVPLERTSSGKRQPKRPEALARYQKDLAKFRADPTKVERAASVLEGMARYFKDHRHYEPQPWVHACNEWFAQLGRAADAVGDPGWVGYRGRPPARDVLAQERLKHLHERLRMRIYQADDALRLELIDVAQAWLDASAAELTSVLSDPANIKSLRGSLAQGYEQLAKQTFAMTGDSGAARTHWAKYVAYRRQTARDPSKYRPSPFPYDDDPEYLR